MEAAIKHARSRDVHIAYRIFGDGPRDIVLIPGTLSHVELLWEVPSNEHCTDHFVLDPETQDVIADQIEEFITARDAGWSRIGCWPP